MSGMPRFTVKQMLIATTLVAIGLGAIVIAFQLRGSPSEFWSKGTPGGMIGGGAMTIGSGVAYPFNKSWKVSLPVGLIVGITAILILHRS